MTFRWNGITNKLDLVGEGGGGGGGMTPSNVLAGQTSDNVDEGIEAVIQGSNVRLNLTNRLTSQIQTTDDELTNLIFFNLGDDPAAYKFWGEVIGFNETSSLACGFSFKAAARTDGSSSVEISQETQGDFAEGIMSDVELTFVTESNNVAVYIEPVNLNGETINWNTVLNYRKVEAS